MTREEKEHAVVKASMARFRELYKTKAQCEDDLKRTDMVAKAKTLIRACAALRWKL